MSENLSKAQKNILNKMECVVQAFREKSYCRYGRIENDENIIREFHGKNPNTTNVIIWLRKANENTLKALARKGVIGYLTYPETSGAYVAFQSSLYYPARVQARRIFNYMTSQSMRNVEPIVRSITKNLDSAVIGQLIRILACHRAYVIVKAHISDTGNREANKINHIINTLIDFHFDNTPYNDIMTQREAQHEFVNMDTQHELRAMEKDAEKEIHRTMGRFAADSNNLDELHQAVNKLKAIRELLNK